jgi:hypothetical protein
MVLLVVFGEEGQFSCGLPTGLQGVFGELQSYMVSGEGAPNAPTHLLYAEGSLLRGDLVKGSSFSNGLQIYLGTVIVGREVRSER